MQKGNERMRNNEEKGKEVKKGRRKERRKIRPSDSRDKETQVKKNKDEWK